MGKNYRPDRPTDNGNGGHGLDCTSQAKPIVQVDGKSLIKHKASLHSPAGSRAAQPCPVETSSASKKWYRAPTHPFIAWGVVHGPLKAALRTSFDPIIRWQNVLTFSNPPSRVPGSVFSSLASPPTHCIFMSGLGYQTKQRDIAFVLLPLCLFAGPMHQLVLSGEGSFTAVLRRHQPAFVTDTHQSPLAGTPLDGSPELCLRSAPDLMYP